MEQKLVNICFDIALSIHASTRLQNLTQKDLAEWVAKQLKDCGFPTVPCGSSWGVLTKEKAV